MGESLSKLTVKGTLGGFPDGAVIGPLGLVIDGVRAARVEHQAHVLGGARLVGEDDVPRDGAAGLDAGSRRDTGRWR